MTLNLIPKANTTNLAKASPLQQAGAAANQAAGNVVFVDYKARKSANTIRRQTADLGLFSQFLERVSVKAGDLQNDPEAWRGVTWGLVQMFAAWQLQNGYAISSINGRLSSVKVYAGMAAKAGTIEPSDIVLIRAVKGYEHKEIPHIDEKRAAAGLETRKGTKKPAAVILSPSQARDLKNQPNTPQGRRDKLLMCIMLNLGLRVGEVAALTVESLDLKAGELRFYRPKVDRTQTHKLDPETLEAARAYMANDGPAGGLIWRASAKMQGLTRQGMSERAITKRVNHLGLQLGISELSAHDLRHTWATLATRNGTTLERLQDAGGWASLAMPGRYIQAAKIANQGVRLEE